MIDQAPNARPTGTTSALRRPGQDAIGGARDSCGWCFRCGDNGSIKKVRRCRRSGKIAGENRTPGGTTADGLLNAGRQASQSLLCCGSEGSWPPEPSAEQIISNGSTPK